MHLLPILIAVLLFGIALLASILWRRWLVAVWIVSVLVLPLIRFQIGAPIYLMDVLTVLLFCQMLGRRDQFLAVRLLPWPWLFMALALLSTGGASLLLFGFHLEQIWIWGHYSLSCLPIAFASVIRSEADGYYTKPLMVGTTASLVVLAAIAIIQYFDLPGRDQIRDLFYGHLESDSKAIGEIVEQMWRNKLTEVTRVPGPHFSPGGFAGMTLLGFLGLIVLQRGKYGFTTYLGVFCTAVVALTTVTRLIVVASAMGLIVFLILCSLKERLKALLLLGAAALVFVTFLGAYFGDAWTTRLGRWDNGVMQDDNVLARAIDGPVRLVNFFIAHPETLILGAGPDPEKLESKIQKESNFESGFVSNSFLLALYYMGAVGFLFYAYFWLKVLRFSLRAPPHLRSAFCGVAVVSGIIIAGDNYAMMFEAAATVLNMIGGFILSEILLEEVPQEVCDDTPASEPGEEVYAA
jgi:hypothetical protein